MTKASAMLNEMLKKHQLRKLSLWLISGIISLLLLWMLKFFWMSSKPVPSGPSGEFAIPVEATSIGYETIHNHVTTVGTLKADEFVIIRPEIEGRIMEIHFQEGQQVKAGDLLIRLDDQVAIAGLAESRASLNLSQAQSKRQNILYEKKYLSTYEKEKSTSKLESDRAMRDRRQKELEKTRIYAPFDGYLGLSDLSLGDYVKSGQDIVNLASMDSLKVEFSVPEIYVPYLQKGQKIKISGEAFSGKEFEGEIYALDSVVDEMGRNLKAKGRLENRELFLKPGMFVRVDIQLSDHKNALWIPEEAIVLQDQMTYAYKVETGHAKKVALRLGMRLQGKVEVLEGLLAQDQVITAGQIKIRDGKPVQVLTKTMSVAAERQKP